MSLEMIDGLGVADVVDAMGMAFQHRAHIIHLDSPDPDRVLFGPAVTIGFLPVRKDLMDPERHSLGPAFYRAIGDDDPTGRVLVLAADGPMTSCPTRSIERSQGSRFSRASRTPRNSSRQYRRASSVTFSMAPCMSMPPTPSSRMRSPHAWAH